MSRLLLCLLLGFSLEINAQSISYTVSMPQPTSHEFLVDIQFKTTGQTYVDFVLPVWSPGRYVVQNFAKSVSNVSAVSGQKKLAVNKTDKTTWRVQTEGVSQFTFSYNLYANNLNGSFSVLDEDHGNFNGPSLFMYADGYRNQPVKLTIKPYGKWKVINGYSKDVNQTQFQFPSYDLLIDTPTEIGNFQVYSKVVRGKNVRVVIHDEGKDTTGLSDFLNKTYNITDAQYRAMPEIDYETYTYLVHFSNKANTFGDAMEHFNSTQVVIKGNFNQKLVRLNALEAISHEHFHAWNLKRLRPTALDKHELAKELFTPSLWFSEGFTEYYMTLSMVRAKVISLNEFVDELESNINSFSNSEGRKKRTTEESSMDTWFWYNSTYENNFYSNWFSYYNQGKIIGLMMDLKLRTESNNQLSLDGFMSHMYQKFYVNEKGDWYYKGKPFEEKDILTELNSYSSKNWTSFWSSYITGYDDIDASLLEKVGLQWSVDSLTTWSSGIRAFPNDKGFYKISSLSEGSDGEKANLQTGDIIVSINGKATLDNQFYKLLDQVQLNQTVIFDVLRDQDLLKISIQTKSKKAAKNLILKDADNSILKSWINK